jgi:pteridine reductase
MLEHLSAECPPVDILVNSASVFPRTPLADVTVEQWDEVHAVNLRAPFLLGRELGMAMAQRGWGKIINISDCAVNRPYKNYLPYLVSKAGLVSLTRVLALELAPHVQVNTIAPGTVLMPEGADGGLESLILAKTPLKRIGTPEDVAKLVRFLVEDGDFATGGFFAMDGGAGIPA